MNFSAWMPIFLAIAALVAFCLWHLAKNDPSFMPKWGWALLVILAAPVGSLIYVVVEVFDAGVKRPDAHGRAPQQE